MSDAPAIDPRKTRSSFEYKHSRPLTCCFWEPRGRFVFFGAEDNLVHRVELANKRVTALARHDSWVRAIGATPDGDKLLTGGYDGRLIWWPLGADAPAPLREVEAHQGWIRALAVSPDGRRVATCGNDRLVKIWDADSGAETASLAGHKSHVYNVAFSPDSAVVYSCDLHGVVRRWDVASRESRELVTVAALHGYDTTFRADIGGARSIALRGDGAVLALGGITNVSNAFAGVGDVAVALVGVADGRVLQLLGSKEKTQGATWGVAWHPADFWIGLSGGGGGWFHFWKGDAPHEFFKLKLPSDGRGMSPSPDRSRAAVAHADQHLRIYDFFGA